MVASCEGYNFKNSFNDDLQTIMMTLKPAFLHQVKCRMYSRVNVFLVIFSFCSAQGLIEGYFASGDDEKQLLDEDF